MDPRPWRRAIAWLALLGPFFYASYGFANAMAARRDGVPSVFFGWEQEIPFVAWTIIPYWTTNAFYVASLFVCRTRNELDTHCLRLLSAQILAVVCFLIWPLAFSFDRPPVDGLPGHMFAALESFDRPYNQAPSLHIALTIILWTLYARHLQGASRWLLHAWFALVCVSVLTTWQHHFIDVPSGLAAGWLCIWLLPGEKHSPLYAVRFSRAHARLRLAMAYLAGSAGCALLAMAQGGTWLWAWWPALSLAMVALNYAFLGPAGFQKRADGRMSLAARWLYAPYFLVAWINSRLWTLRHPGPVEVAGGVWIGRIPSQSSRQDFIVVDVCAELPLPGGARPGDRIVPMLDLVMPSSAQLLAAADAIRTARQHGPVLVCCALGYSRSAVSVAAWLLRDGSATDPDEAIARVRIARRQIVLGTAHRRLLHALSWEAPRTSGATGERAG
ncbi:phosphatase PAP2/dual specificity phosphatase family protein [Luteimonas yindakuii]|uniref:phosphatase PAP2/dual specificity phosphatase family protein n=1 Tax=Luteimonas yindakuii TaxID=2565782 RepID=UPI0011077E37|nr:phosphatase PAP2/dual specificity phosphatase family protein [Luteimonas yindakuii]QCO66891.2 phosphatase PAP2/dual specificity phosphatase family protein [Luteimonas yindakuii]